MNVQLMFTEEMKNESIDVLVFKNNKALNAIKRFGCKTLGDVINNWDMFKQVKGIGTPTQNLIQNKVIDYMISQLSDEQLVEWFNYLLDHNDAEKLRPIIEGFTKVETEVA